MTTMNESMFSKGKQPCFINDNSGTCSNDSQYSNLNLNQAQKCLNGFSPIHFHSKSNNDKYCEISQEFDKDGKREKSYSVNKSLNLCLAAIKIGDKDEEQWKKGGSFEVADNSTLSLHISAYENEAAAFDSFGGKNNETLRNNISRLVRNEKELLTSTFVIQNPFEFSRQQSNKVPDPEVSQFRASQRLLNSNAASKNGQQGSSNSNSDNFAARKKALESKLDEELEDLPPTSVVSKLLFQRRRIDEVCWTIFWRHKDDTLGVTDGETKLYEKQIPIGERKKLVGNVSASLLTDKWRKIFETRGFKFCENDMNDDKIEVEIGAERCQNSVTLSRIKVPGRIAAVFNDMAEDYMAISKENVQFKTKQNTEGIQAAAKRRYDRPKVQPPAKTRRLREIPTGLQFPEENNDAESV